MLKYTSDHEWVQIDNDFATVGITAFAQERLGDLVFIELPKAGSMLQAGGAAAVIEFVKAASDVYAPIDGEVTEVNTRVVEDPTLVNSDPTGAGWLFKLKVSSPSQIEKLLDEAAYQNLIENADPT